MRLPFASLSGPDAPYERPVARMHIPLDRALVVRTGEQMELLTAEQKQELVEIITIEFGPALPLAEFIEVLLSMLEDIAGFETVTPSNTELILNQLWSEYYE